MTLQEFTTVFMPLAIQLRAHDAEEATIRAYYPALKDLEFAFVAMAAERFRDEGGKDGSGWFPRTNEWRDMARTIEIERRNALRARIRELPTPLCEICGDTGWIEDASATRMKRWQPPWQSSNCKVVVQYHGETPRRACACQQTRRLEVLGLKNWPTASDAPRLLPDEPLTEIDFAAMRRRLASHNLPIRARAMPRALPPAIDSDRPVSEHELRVRQQAAEMLAKSRKE